jgi:hypothetical protein
VKRFVFLFGFLVVATGVAAAGVGVSPAELSFELSEGEVQQKQVVLYNLQEGDAAFSVYGGKMVSFLPASGVVEGRGSVAVVVEMNAADVSSGAYEDAFTAALAPDAGGVSLAVGSQVPVHVRVIDAGGVNFFVGVLLMLTIVAVGVGLYAVMIRMRAVKEWLKTS